MPVHRPTSAAVSAEGGPPSQSTWLTHSRAPVDVRLPRIVALGGGTGLPVLLRGLKRAYFGMTSATDPTKEDELLTAIVTMADDGGSSGRLRRQYLMPPPGDIRNCLVALANSDPEISAIFDFRFRGNADVGGHSLGNLILTALGEIEKDFHVAVQRSASLLGVRGRVLPATVEPITLTAEFDDGSSAAGEAAIAGARKSIRRLQLRPDDASALPAAVRAVESADAVVIAPGSLYTSSIAVLLVKDIAEALARTRRPAILVMNLMTEPGETDGYTAADHILAIQRHVPGLRIRDVLLHGDLISSDVARDYASRGSVPVRPDHELLTALGYRIIRRDLLSDGPKVRHDSDKLAAAVIECATEPMP
jgi:uncharacterized cofD-like protein